MSRKANTPPTQAGTGHTENSIFQSSWWLDAVAPGQWSEVRVERGGDCVARLPYVSHPGKFGMTILTMPPLTQTLGPWIKDRAGTIESADKAARKYLPKLIEALPPFDYFSQSFHYSVDNWLPFYWAGFKQTTFYTYVIYGISDHDRVFSDFANQKRSDIKKASTMLSVATDLSPTQFLEHHKSSLRKIGNRASYDQALANRLMQSAIRNDSGKVFYAFDSTGVIHSALFVVWSARSAYLLMTSVDPDQRHSSSLSLLIWEAIKHTSKFTDRFDFEGSMIKGPEHSYRQFGGIRTPYFHISRTSKRMAVLNAAKMLFSSSARS